jgi:hypothetical protein
MKLGPMENIEILELAQEFAELGREVHGDGDRTGAMNRMVELAVQYVGGCRWASITAIRGQQGVSLAMSDPVAAQVDSIQYELDEGPCLRAADEDNSFLAYDLNNEPRWPNFSRKVVESTPVRTVLAFRLVAGTSTALNLYGDSVGAFTDECIDIGTVLAAHASSIVALAEAENQAEHLEVALATNRQIGVAIGVLMAYHKVTEEHAFALLRNASQQLHQKLRDVAAEVVETGALPDRQGQAAARIAATPDEEPAA